MQLWKRRFRPKLGPVANSAISSATRTCSRGWPVFSVSPRRLARKSPKFEDRLAVEQRRQEDDQHDLRVELHLGQPRHEPEHGADDEPDRVRHGLAAGERARSPLAVDTLLHLR